MTNEKRGYERRGASLRFEVWGTPDLPFPHIAEITLEPVEITLLANNIISVEQLVNAYGTQTEAGLWTRYHATERP